MRLRRSPRPHHRARTGRVLATVTAATVLVVGINVGAGADDTPTSPATVTVTPEPTPGPSDGVSDEPTDEPTDVASEPTQPTGPTEEPTEAPSSEVPTQAPDEDPGAESSDDQTDPADPTGQTDEATGPRRGARADATSLAARAPLTCPTPGLLYQARNGNNSSVFEVELGDGTFNETTQVDQRVNAVGYNSVDNYVYGVIRGNDRIVRIDDAGVTTDLGLPQPLPGWAGSVVGDVDDEGFLWTLEGGLPGGERFAKTRLGATTATVVDQGFRTRPVASAGGNDWVYVPSTDRLYMVAYGSAQGSDSFLLTFNPNTTQWEAPIALGTAAPQTLAGAAFTDNRYVYISFNNGPIWRLDLADPDPATIAASWSFFAAGPSSDDNDGARCATAPVPVDFGDAPNRYRTRLEGVDGPRHAIRGYDAASSTASLMLGTTVDLEGNGAPGAAAAGDDNAGVDDEDGIVGAAPTRVPGQPYTVQVRVTNNLSAPATLAGWLDVDLDGVFDPEEVATAAVTAQTTGTVPLTFPAGAVPGASYLRLRLQTGTTAPEAFGVGTAGEVEDYAVPSAAGDPVLADSKSVTPGAGTAVVAGDQVVYRLTFTNSGTAPGVVARDDVLSDVLDDATFNPGSLVVESGPALTLANDGSRITVRGTQPANSQTVVRYSVTVKEASAPGPRNYLLANSLVGPGAAGGCTAANPEDCTSNPTPNVTDSKSVTPGAGSVVTAGQQVVYRLTFTNSGSAPGTVAKDDVLTGVLDDATFDDGSLVVESGPPLGLNRSGDRIEVRGTLPQNQTTVVRYSVTVKEASAPGPRNYALANSLVGPGAAGGCTAANPEDCTSNPTPNVTDSKSVTPGAGTAVAAGQQVVYRLTFTNSGTAPGGVAKDDVLGDVLDDATFDAGSLVVESGPALALDYDGSRITVRGTQPASSQTVVRYSVTVKEASAPGPRNYLLANSLVGPGAAGGCTAANPEDCTSNPMPNVTDSKSVTPGSGSVVTPGQQVVYRLTFTNSGTAPGGVAKDDVLGDVLDDATFDAGSLVVESGPPLALDRDGDRITVRGTLPQNQTTVVRYSVTVKEAGPGLRNNSLGNSLVEPGATGGCTAANPEDCTSNPMPNVTDSKSVTPGAGTVVTAGQQVVYRLTFTNSGTAPGGVAKDDVLTGVLDDATFDDGSLVVESGPALALDRDGDRITVRGTLPPISQTVVRYSVTVNGVDVRGDSSLGNSLVAPSATGGCTAANPEDCTTNPMPRLVDSKSVDVGDGAVVAAGQVVTYRLTFANSGTADAPVERDDVLTDVLDDAEIAAEPAVESGPALTVDRQGERLTVRGTQPAGTTTVVVYSVTVKPAEDRRNSSLGNALVAPGAPGGAPCAPGDPDCTTNPMPAVVDTKSVDVGDGAVVRAGDLVTYTLTFANDGTATGPVLKDDDVSDVVDDAVVVSQPVSDNPTVTVSEIVDGLVQVRGSLAPDQGATVTYSVRVRPEGQRTNNRLGNVLLVPGTTAPTCVTGDPDCTTNPMPEVIDAKIVRPASGTTVAVGQELTYTLSFTNNGTAPGAVAKDDVLGGVLDDAELVDLPSSSDPALSVGDVVDGRFSVTGTLQPLQTVTVEYTVQVLPDAERGDNLIANYLVEAGTTPPTQCTGDDCTVSFVPEIVDSKSADPAARTTVLPGDRVTYTLTFGNIGTGPGAVEKEDVVAGVLDDAEIVSAPTADDPALTVSAIANGRFSVTGTLAAGQTVEVTYTVQVLPDAERVANGSDNRLLNQLVLPGATPDDQCTGGQTDCTVHGIPLITDAKTATPADGARVLPGDVVTYTLTFRNDGTGPGPVAKDDVVSDVLDDADIVSGPTSSDPALGVSAIAGGRFSVTGTLAADQVVTVTYAVEVLPDDERVARGGNDALRNALVLPGGTPTPCDPADADCTVHGIPRLVDNKSASPADGGNVLAGQQVTYTLTFDNLGTAPGDLVKDDVVSGVLDDAELVSGPTSSDPAVTVSPIADGRFTVTGSIAPNTPVTVTYTVEVLPDDERVANGGDDLLANFLVAPGATPPATCDAGDADCTRHTMPRLVDRKDTDVGDGTVVLQGDEVTYTLTFGNEGTGPGDVAKDDDLSGVLDDAELVGLPSSSDPALSSSITGDRLSVIGTLQPDQTVTITYTVRVKPDDQRVADGGDDQLLNALVAPGGTAPPCSPGDADCTNQPIPRLVDGKSIDVGDGTVVVAGDEVTYTLTFGNEGKGAGDVDREDDLSGVLDDAELVSGPTSSDAALTATLVDDRVEVTGTLQPAQLVTVTYTVRVRPDEERFDRGADDQLVNAIVDPGESAEACDPAGPDCVTNGIPRLRDEKVADPVSGTVVLPGERVTYTLSFRNDGKGAGDVARDDDLSSVLDDATLVTPPASSDPALTVSPVTDGRFSVTGTLQPGQAVTVSYEVDVLPDADRQAAGGDDQLLNFLLDPGEAPPESCTVDMPSPRAAARARRAAGYEGVDCVVGPIPRLVETKTVDPSSGSAVAAGDELVYTLTFRNEGKGAGDLAREDDLTHVLDDARLAERPAASDPALTVGPVVDDRFAVTGTLQAGQEVTVGYTVEVLPDGRRGDDVIANFLLGPGEPVPSEPTCDPESPTCTVSFAAEVVATKNVRPGSGTQVRPGQELTYLLRFFNTGAGAGDVTWDDDLSGVLDDAELVGGPSVALVGGAPTDAVRAAVRGTTLEVRGRLEPGERVVVTYRVRVDDPVDGDGELRNVLRPQGIVSGDGCAPSSTLCTRNPIERPEPEPVPDGGGLPDTGGPPVGLLALGAGLLLTGLAVLAPRVRRRRRVVAG